MLHIRKLSILRSIPIFSDVRNHRILRSICTVHLNPSSDLRCSNIQITRLSNLNQIAEARKLFDKISNPDLIAWTSLISAYVRNNQIHIARFLFDRPDSKKNVVTYTALLNGYVRSRHIQEAENLFNNIPDKDKNVVTYNTMIEGYMSRGLVDKALNLFYTMPEKNLVSWNAMLIGLCKSGYSEKAYKLFCMMEEKDLISWNSMVTGLAMNGKVVLARDLFEKIPERNVICWNAMISAYMKNKRLNDAVELFERMDMRDLSSWNAMITGFIQNEELNRARFLFNEMRERNVVSWTSLITGYVQNGENETALKLFVSMLIDGVRPNEGSFVNVLSAISNLAALREGQQVHQMISKTSDQSKPFVNSALINMYSKCGEIGTARKVFELEKCKDLVTWNSMIAALAHHGWGREVVNFFKDMQSNGFKPNDVTYIEVLSACSHSGLVDEGVPIFESMIKDKSIEVREDHYTCLVDLCSRAGQVEKAINLIKRFDLKPSGSIWGALIGGCNNHGKVKIADIAAQKLLEVEPNNAGTYTLLSNVYASAGRWDEAKKVRLMMKQRGLKKQPGCSWIDVGSGSNVFLVHDKSHRDGDLIYSVVKDLHRKMKLEGCVPYLDDQMVVALKFNLLKRFDLKPSRSIQGALIGGCINHGNVNFADIAAKKF